MRPFDRDSEAGRIFGCALTTSRDSAIRIGGAPYLRNGVFT